MKKLLTILLALCSLLFFAIGCNEQALKHVHTFNQKIVSSQYLASQATCEQKALYYYSCECGDIGSVTFENGDFGKHEYGAFKNNGNGTHTKTCINHSEHTITEECYGGEATCREKATCLGCNAKYGELEEHTYSKEYSTSDTHHWYDSTCGCNLKKDYAEHVIGEDNCCETCSIPMSSTIGVIYDTSSDGTYAEVIDYDGTSKKVKIADTYNGLPVKTIYDRAFYDTNITMIIIPDSVTSIGDRAFVDCNSLTSITIPDSVTSIGGYAFYDCSSLTSIIIGDGVTSIGNYAFAYCSSLTSVIIPDSVTSIGYNAFWNCRSLTSVTIGDSVTSIGESAFADCPYTVSGNLKYVGNEDNPYLLLVGTANANLSTYTINKNTKYICSLAFSSCSRLSTITIPDSVIFIGYQAFSSCNSLTSITIPDSVTSIVYWAFVDCSSLSTVYYKGTAEKWAKIGIGSNNYNLTNATRYYYIENEEDLPNDNGKYWHFVDGVPTVWVKE